MTVLRALPALALFALPAIAHADERRIMVTSFDSVRIEGPFEVEVRVGGATGAVVSGNPQAISTVDIRVEDRVLVVAPSANAWGGWPDARADPPRIVATVPFVRSATMIGNGRLAIDRMAGQDVAVAISGSGIIAVAAVAADQFQATLTGTGTLAVQGQAGRARFVSNGANKIDAAALLVRDLTVQSESAGESSFAASQTATVTATGLGSVTVAGSPACTVSGPGPGPVRCGDGKAE